MGIYFLWTNPSLRDSPPSGRWGGVILRGDYGKVFKENIYPCKFGILIIINNQPESKVTWPVGYTVTKTVNLSSAVNLLNLIIWQTNLIIWQTSLILWQTNLIIWQTNLIIWQTNLIIIIIIYFQNASYGRFLYK